MKDGKFICGEGDECWYLNGFRHRKDGPAIVCLGEEEWWLNGNPMSKEQWWERLSDELKIKTLFDGEGV